VIVEADWCIGEFMNTLEQEGLLENTLVILSSDNGPVLNDGYEDDAEEKNGSHTPAGKLRGGKYSLFEAGTRLPLITYWPGHIKPGVSEAIVSQVDLLSSLAQLVGSDIRSQDGKELLDVFFGKSNQGRDELVLEATTRTALRKGDWVLIPPYKGPPRNEQVNIELGNADTFQLYNIKEDVSQINNLAKANPEKLQEMIAAFQKIRGVSYDKIEALELK
jgi:arylsulfatase A-like enzyme